MGFEKYVDIAEKMDQMIRMKSTGTPEEFARKTNVSLRWLHEYIDIMEGLGAKIEYDRKRKTYFYAEDGRFDFRFRKKK